MPEQQNKSEKRGLLKRVRRQRLKSISILPSLITLINGICGFASIMFTGRGEFVTAGFLILAAMVADMLDGRVARFSQNTSSFGGQLDSLCDAISFGVAPAFLMLRFIEVELSMESLDFAEKNFFQRFIWLAAAAYVCCAVIRLARFNVENEEDESAHMSFIGLPTPAAAGIIVSLVLFHQEHNLMFSALKIITYCLPFISLGTAGLMVSRIRFPHILNQYLRGKKPFGHLITALLLLVLFLFWLREALVLSFCGFALSGFLKWLLYRVHILKLFTKFDNKAELKKTGTTSV